ncbi:MAG: cyclase family protein [Lachnospiraceae bacterium]|nr:cyclase family protein [Lachnospiraceae bacterium]
MKIYDISKELFSASVYPGDPVPSKQEVMGFDKEVPDHCQVTMLSLGSHSGTHMDAPRHFVPGGKDMEELDIRKCLGPCIVVSAGGDITADMARGWIKEWESSDGASPAASGGSPEDGEKASADGLRLLIRGDITITEEAAQVFADSSLSCLGVEGMTVGTQETGVRIHQILLGAEVVIIESLVLRDVPDGRYFLHALPLKMRGLDGSPVRAVLTAEE